MCSIKSESINPPTGVGVKIICKLQCVTSTHRAANRLLFVASEFEERCRRTKNSALCTHVRHITNSPAIRVPLSRAQKKLQCRMLPFEHRRSAGSSPRNGAPCHEPSFPQQHQSSLECKCTNDLHCMAITCSL